MQIGARFWRCALFFALWRSRKTTRVDKKCEKLLYNIYNLKYKEGTSKIDIPTYQQIKQSKELKFLSHPMDAASYLVDFYWPITL